MRIALIGDSITENWGADCPQLVTELKRLYTRTHFEIDNHGLSGTRAGYGLWRIGHDYQDNQGRRRACLSYHDPELVIVESFAYTNCADDAESLADYRDALRHLMQEIERTTAARILFWVAPPPDRDRFLESRANFYFTPKATRQRLADRARLYLEEALDIARDEGWPTADVYSEIRRRAEAGDNLRRYINQSDNLHPSLHGYSAIARIVARAVDAHMMIKEGSES